MYNSEWFFVNNPLNRYTLSPRNALKKNTDGSPALYPQKDNPGPDRVSCRPRGAGAQSTN
jgi:hypothetical protein